MMLWLVYFVLRGLLHALALSDRSDPEREAELLVLRHRLMILSKGPSRPSIRRRDRTLLAVAHWPRGRRATIPPSWLPRRRRCERVCGIASCLRVGRRTSDLCSEPGRRDSPQAGTAPPNLDLSPQPSDTGAPLRQSARALDNTPVPDALHGNFRHELSGGVHPPHSHVTCMVPGPFEGVGPFPHGLERADGGRCPLPKRCLRA